MMKFSKKIYIGIIILLLLLPAVTINTKPEQSSEIDNKTLMEWSEVTDSSDFTTALEQYIQDRIGFREAALYGYISANQQVFRYLTDPRRMYGEDGHMFYADSGYIDDYQHMNVEPDKALCESMSAFLCRTKEYCNSKDIAFIYCLVPDKKTIYPEYFPDYYNVYGDLSRTDYLLQCLKNTELDYLYPKEELLAGKEKELVYYKEYDPTHWNAHGTFIGQRALTEHMQTYIPQLKLPDKEDFDITYDTITTTANIQINESSPIYTLKNPGNITNNSTQNPLEAHHRYFTHFINNDLPDAPKLMIFCDSYFYNMEMYYYTQFAEVTFLHNQRNIERMQEFIDYYDPDIVVFENVERVLSVDFSPQLLDSISYQ